MSKHSDELFAALQRVLPQHLLSRLVGKLATTQSPKLKNKLIKLFIKQYDINLSELELTAPEDYATFNDFFTRPLLPNARPIAKGENILVSPADGAISQVGVIHKNQLIQAKGKTFSVDELLGKKLASLGNFSNGLFTTIYLSPKDYHRVHMPCDGKLISSHYIPGKLFSVNQVTAEQITGLFARNERLACVFDTPFGRCAQILVGAMLVAGIQSSWHGNYSFGQTTLTEHNDTTFNKGDEMGQFKFGSTVILIFEENALSWESSLKSGDQVKMGEAIAFKR